MNIPKIQIQTTNAILGLRTTKSNLEIEQPRAELNQQQLRAIMKMSTTKPKLSIDTTEVRADLDLKSVFKRTEEFSTLGHQGAMEGIEKRVSEGRQMMQIENGGNAIQQIAQQNANPPPKSLGIRFIPNPLKLKLSFAPGSLNINVEPQKPINEVKINKPMIRYTPSKVSGVMEQWNSIRFDVKL